MTELSLIHQHQFAGEIGTEAPFSLSCATALLDSAAPSLPTRAGYRRGVTQYVAYWSPLKCSACWKRESPVPVQSALSWRAPSPGSQWLARQRTRGE